MTKSLTLAVLLLLGACHQSPQQKSAATPAADGYIAKVQALSSGERAGVLYRAIRKSGGQGCQGVTKVEPMPSQDGKPVWRATCAEGSQWMVALSDDGTALVTGARDNIHLNQ